MRKLEIKMVLKNIVWNGERNFHSIYVDFISHYVKYPITKCMYFSKISIRSNI